MSRHSLPVCGLPVNDTCALHAGHSGPCRSTWGQRADRLRSALQTLLDDLRHGGTFRERKDLRRAARALEEPLLREGVQAQATDAERDARLADRYRRLKLDSEVVDPSAYDRGVDARRPVVALLAAIRVSLTELERLLNEEGRFETYEDDVYRLYHHSFKVFALQEATARILAALQGLAPERPLNADFMAIMAEGTGLHFEPSTNRRWMASTRPIVEAFWHARHMLELAVRTGHRMEEAPMMLPSGWATLLYLYNLR